MNKISVLQVGNEDLSLQLHIPDFVEWNYINDLRLAKERGYDVCVLNRCVNEKEARILLKKSHLIKQDIDIIVVDYTSTLYL